MEPASQSHFPQSGKVPMTNTLNPLQYERFHVGRRPALLKELLGRHNANSPRCRRMNRVSGVHRSDALFGDETTRVVTCGHGRRRRPPVPGRTPGSRGPRFDASRRHRIAGVRCDPREISPKQPVVFITAHGTATTAIEAMKRGAFDYLIAAGLRAGCRTSSRRAFEAAR